MMTVVQVTGTLLSIFMKAALSSAMWMEENILYSAKHIFTFWSLSASDMPGSLQRPALPCAAHQRLSCHGYVKSTTQWPLTLSLLGQVRVIRHLYSVLGHPRKGARMTQQLGPGLQIIFYYVVILLVTIVEPLYSHVT